MLRPGDVLQRFDGAIFLIINSDDESTTVLNKLGASTVSTIILDARIDRKQFKIVLPIEHMCDERKQTRTKRRRPRRS